MLQVDTLSLSLYIYTYGSFSKMGTPLGRGFPFGFPSKPSKTGSPIFRNHHIYLLRVRFDLHQTPAQKRSFLFVLVALFQGNNLLFLPVLATAGFEEIGSDIWGIRILTYVRLQLLQSKRPLALVTDTGCLTKSPSQVPTVAPFLVGRVPLLK